MICISLIFSDVEHLFMFFSDHLYVFFGEMSIKVSYLFLDWVFFFFYIELHELFVSQGRLVPCYLFLLQIFFFFPFWELSFHLNDLLLFIEVLIKWYNKCILAFEMLFKRWLKSVLKTNTSLLFTKMPSLSLQRIS